MWYNIIIICFKVLPLIYFIISFYCHFSSLTPSSLHRIYRIRRSIGMRLASFAINVVFHWWINNSVRNRRKSTAGIAMIHSLPVAVMVVGKFFVRVRMVQFNSFNFTLLISFFFEICPPIFSLSLSICPASGLIYWPHPYT